jgi:methyltransferase family protein
MTDIIQSGLGQWRKLGDAERVKGAARLRRDRFRVIMALPRHGIGAEVGVWRGDFSALILRLNRPKTLFLVDPWAHSDEHQRSMYGRRAQPEMDEIHKSVVERFARREQVVVRRETSAEAGSSLSQLDWAYIDGDHTYEAVKADLEAFGKLVRPGGVMAGDDYAANAWWSGGVRRAVEEYGAQIGRPATVFGNQFLFRL